MRFFAICQVLPGHSVEANPRSKEKWDPLPLQNILPQLPKTPAASLIKMPWNRKTIRGSNVSIFAEPNGQTAKGFPNWEDFRGTWLTGRHGFGNRYVLHAWNIHYLYIDIYIYVCVCMYVYVHTYICICIIICVECIHVWVWCTYMCSMWYCIHFLKFSNYFRRISQPLAVSMYLYNLYRNQR